MTAYHRLSFAIVLCCLSGCQEDEPLFGICPDECYTGPRETNGVGACRAGVPVCSDSGEVLECVGEVLPTEEVGCDTLDSDCDGTADDNRFLPPTADENSCTQCGKCSGTTERCDSKTGEWFCDYPNGPPSPEVCDGTRTDEDCDCWIDEQEDLYPEGETVFCYTGPEGTALNGECRPGIESCDPWTGLPGCSDITPQAEACDGTDRDCNGLIDDVDTVYEGVAMILGIDVSGSMSGVHQAVRNVICTYADASVGGDTDYRFGLVSIADPNGSYTLTSDLTDADNLCDILTQLDTGGGDEPTLTAAMAVVDPNNPLGISWPVGSKRVFVGFADEVAAVSSDPFTGPDATITNTLGYCSASETDIFWFISEPYQYAQQALGCNGEVFQLTTHEEWMLEDMNSIISGFCTDRTKAP